MSITLATALTYAGLTLAGYIAGALSRQPEINELKQQVRSLQKEERRLHSLIEKQAEQIKVLTVRYEALRGWDFLEKRKQKDYLRGSLMYQYALKEYLEMLIDADQTDCISLNESEVKFYNAFGKILNMGEITDKDRSLVFKYITEKYGTEIKRFEEPSFQTIFQYIA